MCPWGMRLCAKLAGTHTAMYTVECLLCPFPRAVSVIELLRGAMSGWTKCSRPAAAWNCALSWSTWRLVFRGEVKFGRTSVLRACLDCTHSRGFIERPVLRLCFVAVHSLVREKQSNARTTTWSRTRGLRCRATLDALPLHYFLYALHGLNNVSR